MATVRRCLLFCMPCHAVASFSSPSLWVAQKLKLLRANSLGNAHICTNLVRGLSFRVGDVALGYTRDASQQ